MINYSSKISETNSIVLNMILSNLQINNTIDSNYVKKVNSYDQRKHNALSKSYSSKNIERTFSITPTYKKIKSNESEILRKLNVFLNSLFFTQETLGEEFSKVLFDNIFDLY